MTDADLSEDVEERFQVLENKVLYQDRTIDELNTVVTRQQDQIDLLTDQLQKIRDFIRDQGEGTIDASAEPPPPHY